MNILSIGNSFAMDTMQHMADIASSAGICDFTYALLYIGGCSIKRHYNNAVGNLADYVYHVNTGKGWQHTERCSIADALADRRWDVISIQHGTGDGSRYTSVESYENLLPLIRWVRQQLSYPVKIAFNMAWVADPESTHHEITSYGGDQWQMYEKLTKLTETTVAPLVDVVSPTGTAIQNARTKLPQKLTRDNFHLSYMLGRYIAGLTFLKTLCGLPMEAVTWRPEEVTAKEAEVAKKAAEAAVKRPFAVTEDFM